MRRAFTVRTRDRHHGLPKKQQRIALIFGRILKATGGCILDCALQCGDRDLQERPHRQGCWSVLAPLIRCYAVFVPPAGLSVGSGARRREIKPRRREATASPSEYSSWWIQDGICGRSIVCRRWSPAACLGEAAASACLGFTQRNLSIVHGLVLLESQGRPWSRVEVGQAAGGRRRCQGLDRHRHGPGRTCWVPGIVGQWATNSLHR